MARRGDPDALALLRAPDFPAVLSYLYDWYAEFMLWCGEKPDWCQLQAWSAMMRHRLTAFEVRALRLIANAHRSVVSET